MKAVLVLSVFIFVAFAAPTEDKVEVPEEVVEAPMKEMAVAAEPVSENHKGEAPESRNYCPEGWESHNSRCFKFVQRLATWYDAEEHCVILGGHLASVSGRREYNQLQLFTSKQGPNTNNEAPWLGGFNLEGRWLWSDGEDYYYENWGSKYTPSSCPPTTNPCIFLQTHDGWGSSTCKSTRPFICVKDPYSC